MSTLSARKNPDLPGIFHFLLGCYCPLGGVHGASVVAKLAKSFGNQANPNVLATFATTKTGQSFL